MNNGKVEGAFSIAAAILLLFTAMLNPIYSVIASVVLLLSYGLVKFLKK